MKLIEKMITVIFYSSLLSLLVLVFVPPSQCRFISNEPPSKFDILQLLLHLKSNPYQMTLGGRIFKKIHNLPFVQFVRTVNDIVEPVVTAAEVALLFYEFQKLKHKKLNGDNDNNDGQRQPIHLTTNDQIIVFSGNNKLEVNHYKKPVDTQNMIDQEYLQQMPEQSMLQEETTVANNDLLHLESTTFGSDEPILLSSKVRHSPKGDDNYFQMNFESNDNQDFNLVRDLPKNFALTQSNPIKVTKKVKRRKRRRRKQH